MICVFFTYIYITFFAMSFSNSDQIVGFHCALCIRLTATKSHLIENLRIQFGYNYQPERTFKVGFSKSVRSF